LRVVTTHQTNLKQDRPQIQQLKGYHHKGRPLKTLQPLDHLIKKRIKCQDYLIRIGIIKFDQEVQEE
jgi:hypothetical protein